MDLTRVGAQYMGLGLVFIDLFLKAIAIYTMVIIIKALKIYIKKA